MAKDKEKRIDVTSSEEELSQNVETASNTEKENDMGNDSESVADYEQESKEESEMKESEPELSNEEKLEKQVKELNDKVLRTVAEFENYKKRVARQYEDTIRNAKGYILTDFLEILDNFERAINSSKENQNIDSIRQGTELIFNQMNELLMKYEVTPIKAVGEDFDPNLHEALMQSRFGRI